MNAVPPSFAAAGNLPGAVHRDAADALGAKWAALHDAAQLVAVLARIAVPPVSAAAHGFPARIGEAAGWRRALAEQGIGDLAAVMEPGIAALLAVNARHADPAPAALALWQEFVTARDALLALAPEHH